MLKAFLPNKIIVDDFGRKDGILLLNKPLGITSHDLVDLVRNKLQTREVGHAGALDPAASGLMIILVGKATKLSNDFLNKGKRYKAEVLFGVSTDSADREGQILEVLETAKYPGDEQMQKILQSFTPSYQQFVPIFSSVKKDGQKLRVLARQSESVEISFTEDGRKFAKFVSPNQTVNVEIPRHLVEIPEIALLESSTIDISTHEFGSLHQLKGEYPVVQIDVACSKGTYIRSLAEDIGAKLPSPAPAMLWNLVRTGIGEYSLEDAVSIEQLVV